MKCVLIIFIALFILSCVDNNNFKQRNINPIERYEGVIHFEYKGHDYIEFYLGGGAAYRMSIVHDPDCKKCDSIK